MKLNEKNFGLALAFTFLIGSIVSLVLTTGFSIYTNINVPLTIAWTIVPAFAGQFIMCYLGGWLFARMYNWLNKDNK